MQISSNVPSSLAGSSVYRSEKKQNSSRPSAQAPDTGMSDSVTLSPDAKLLAEAQKTAQASPLVREDRVSALRLQIANGTYQPNSQLIAQHLVQEEPGLFAF